MILETERLYLREMNQSDYESLCRILQDNETMYAYEGAFTDTEEPGLLNELNICEHFKKYIKFYYLNKYKMINNISVFKIHFNIKTCIF